MSDKNFFSLVIVIVLGIGIWWCSQPGEQPSPLPAPAPAPVPDPKPCPPNRPCPCPRCGGPTGPDGKSLVPFVEGSAQ